MDEDELARKVNPAEDKRKRDQYTELYGHKLTHTERAEIDAFGKQLRERLAMLKARKEQP